MDGNPQLYWLKEARNKSLNLGWLLQLEGKRKKSYTGDIQKGKIPNSLLKSLVWNLKFICIWQIKRLKRVRHDWAMNTHTGPKDLNRNLAAAVCRKDRFWSVITAMLTTFLKKVLIYFITWRLYLSFVCQISAVSPKTHITKG